VHATRDRLCGYQAIGVRYEDLRPEHMVVVDMRVKVVEGKLKFSSDTASHLYIYRHRRM